MSVRFRLRSSTFSSLRVRNFRLFIAGQAVSTTGTWMQFIALPLLVLQLTDSGVAVGIATALSFAPTLALGAWGGVLADRVDNRRLIITTQIAFAILAFALWGVVAADVETVGLVYVLSFLTGIVTAIDTPTRQAFFHEMVGREELTNAMSLHTATFTGGRVLGSGLGGLLIARVGIASLFLLNALSYLAVVAALFAMRASELHPRERVARAKGQIREGIRYVWNTFELRVAMLVMLCVFTFAFNWMVLLPLYATRDLHGSEGTFGTLASVFGAGSLIGALAMAGRASRPNVRWIAVTAALMGAFTGVVALFATRAVAFSVMPLVGAAGIAFAISSNATLQLTSSERMRGRVMALYSVIFLGSTPIGGPIGGWVAERFGARAALGMGAVIAIVAGLVGLALARRGPARRPSVSHEHEPEDEDAFMGTAAAARPRSAAR